MVSFYVCFCFGFGGILFWFWRGFEFFGGFSVWFFFFWLVFGFGFFAGVIFLDNLLPSPIYICCRFLIKST